MHNEDEFDDDTESDHHSAPKMQEHRPIEERRSFRNARDLLVDELYKRAQRANPKLRAQLLGSVLVQINGSKERFLLDWGSEDLRVEATDREHADCIIRISEDNLMKIAHGDLNPQIGMLSDKIHLQGSLNLAVYFFNLIAPMSSVL